MTEEPRISEIRDLVTRHRANVSKHAEPDELDKLLGIDVDDPAQRYANLLVKLSGILDKGSKPAVFLPGDVLPRNVAVLNTAGVLYGPAPGWTLSIPGVAIQLPSAAEVEALVEQARDEREEAA